MNGPNWLRRHSSATATAPERNGSAPSETELRLRPRVADAPAAVRVRPRAGRLLQPLPLVGAVLVLVALVGYWSVYRASTKRTPVLVAAHALSAGTVLRADDLRTGELAGDAGTMAALVPERELDSALGHSLAAAVPAGAPLPLAALAGSANGSSAFTLVLPALHALAGALAPGDRVTVLATYGTGSGQARTKAIARGLEVLAVGGAPSGIDSASASVPVTLALPDPSLASALALANSDAKIDLLRESGGARTAPIPPASETGGP
jgi:Flp pilus assembly protein CpaB